MFLLLTLLSSVPLSFASSCSNPASRNPNPFPFPQKRSPQSNDDDFSFGPSPITIDLPPQFLPPPWSPNSDLDSPYPSSGVSPWDDSGRSEMLDNEPSVWRTCPEKHLDCRKCPMDLRCRRAGSATTEMAGPNFAIPPEDDGNSECTISKCHDSWSSGCGANARCTRGYCVCDLGMKGSGEQFRGTEGLGSITVYVDPSVDCDTKCDDWSCKEVEQLGEDVCWRSGEENSSDEEDEDDNEKEDESDSDKEDENINDGGNGNLLSAEEDDLGPGSVANKGAVRRRFKKML